jgi:RNA polymerase sigma-70 factor (ECF subfamily)
MRTKKRLDRSHFLRLLAKSEPVIRSYLRSLVQDYHDHSEIMQNTFITAWEKFAKFEGDENDFCKWACVIARYQALKYRQTQARDKWVLSDKLLETISTEGVNDVARTEQWLKKLEDCLKELPEPNRDLIQKAYTPKQSIKAMAAERKTTPDALYQKLRRIRKALAKCMDIAPGSPKKDSAPAYSI